MNAWKDRAVRLARTLYILAVAASVWLVMAGTALAKYKDPDAPENAGPDEKSYVLPYLLVVLCVSLGLMVICRPSRRENEPKYPVQEEG